MKYFLFLLITIIAGVASAEHFHSYLYGFSVATVAVACCYWLAFRSLRYPQLGLVLLICGMLTKLIITVVGVVWGVQAELITSPLIFSLAYLFFAGLVTYLLFSRKDKQVQAKLKAVAA